jgi:hypothetical protein
VNIEIHLIQIEGFDTGDPRKTRSTVLCRNGLGSGIRPYDTSPLPRVGETMSFISTGEDVERPIDSIKWLVDPGNIAPVPTLHLKVSMCKDTETFDKREANWTGAGFVITAKKSMDDKHLEWVRKGGHLTDG